MLKISIITAVFNNKRYIQACLDSLASQIYRNVEHIVVDGGSFDGTLDVLKMNEAQIDTLVSEPDKGVCDAWNKGVALASGDIIGFLHSDDVFFDDLALERVAEEFNSGDIDVAYADLVHVNPITGKIIRRWYAGEFKANKLDNGWMPPHPTLFVRKEVYDNVSCFDLSFSISGDYLSILNIFRVPDLRVAYIPQFLVRQRTGGVSSRPSNWAKKMKQDLRALKLVGYSEPRALFILIVKNLRKLPQFFIKQGADS